MRLGDASSRAAPARKRDQLRCPAIVCVSANIDQPRRRGGNDDPR